MEARKITVVSTKTQKKSVIMSGAETLGELKHDLYEAGIDYDGMTFYEGTSKTELKTDESVLPKDIPYTNRTTGETKPTNELVFMLTNTNKKIKSGAMSRAEIFSTIKSMGLQDACIKKYGRNFTQVSSPNLLILIEEHQVKAAAPTVKEAKKMAEITSAAPAHEGCVDVQARAAIKALVTILCDGDYINEYEAAEVTGLLGASAAPAATEYKSDSASPYDDNEIDAMFRDMC